MPSNFYNVRVNRVAEFQCSSDWYWIKEPGTTGQSSGFEGYDWNFNIWLITKGKGNIQTPHGAYKLIPGSCFILRGDETYSANHDPDNPLVVIAVHFDYLDHHGNIHIPVDTRLCRDLDSLGFFIRLVKRAENAHLQGKANEAAVWMQALLLEIDSQDQESKYSGYEQAQVKTIARVCSEIRANPGATYSVQSLAQTLHCSPRHFSRLFYKFQGISPQEFIVSARIDAARTLLRSSSQPISRIAEILGFSDTSFFSRQFKKRVSLSPLAFRKGR